MLSVKQRLQQFEQPQQQHKPAIPAKPAASPLTTRLASKHSESNELLGDSPTSTSASDALLRPLKPSPSPSNSPQHSRPTTPAGSTSTSPPQLPLRSKPSSNSLNAPALPPRKPAKATSVPGPVLPPRKPAHAPEGKRRPVDPRAKQRFESLFDAQLSVAPQRWTEDKVPGKVVCVLWMRSGVSKAVLKDVW